MLTRRSKTPYKVWLGLFKNDVSLALKIRLTETLGFKKGGMYEIQGSSSY